MAKIKICGIKRIEDINYVNEFLPDYIGFVFAGEKRKITFEKAKELKKHLDKRILTVGVFVNENPKNIIQLCNDNIIDLVQLHGDEDAEYISNLKKNINSKIIKAYRVSDKISSHSTAADYLLFDTYSPNEYGGSGKTFDWDLVGNCDKDFFLAGGIDLNNMESAIATANPFCIDISSGCESSGVKDRQKIKEIMTKIKL